MAAAVFRQTRALFSAAVAAFSDHSFAIAYYFIKIVAESYGKWYNAT